MHPSTPRGRLLLVTTLVIALLFHACTTNAESTNASDGPLIHYSFVTGTRVDLLPRQPPAHLSPADRLQHATSPILHHDDSFRLSFTAYNTTFQLHLRPNEHLIHPKATIKRYVNGSQVVEPLLKQNVWAFKGAVLQTGGWSDARLEADRSKLARLLTAGESEDDDDNEFWEDGEHLPGVLGWARILVHHDTSGLEYEDARKLIYEGVFTANGEMYHIKHEDTFDVVSRPDDPVLPNRRARGKGFEDTQMIVYRDADKRVKQRDGRGWRVVSVQERVGTCAGGQTIQHRQKILGKSDYLERQGRWGLTRNKHGKVVRLERRANPIPAGCPRNKMIIYMGVAADCSYVTNYKTQDAATKQILMDWNQASKVYESTFNVQLGIVLLDIRQPQCGTSQDAWDVDCSDAYTINNRLSDFSRWRGNTPNDGAGLWHLMTKCGSGPKIGVAWLKALCQTQVTTQPNDSGSGTDYTTGTGVSSIVKDEWKVVAHEIGHNFGAQHDCDASTCPCVNNCGCCPCQDQCDCQGTYLMNPTADVKTDAFSPCSINEICANYQALSTCADNTPTSKKLYSINMCGNGLKEDGEQCDCGNAADCANDKCCDGTTCKLKAGAVCSDKNDDCCQNCQLKPKDTQCRDQISVCDIVEKCDGVSSSCPPDKFLKDGTVCDKTNSLKCASGLCTSRDAQCQARGTSRFNFSKACPISTVGSTCAMTCLDTSNPPSCYQISGFFVDGTECGNGGYCSKGQCQGDFIFNGLGKYLLTNYWVIITFGAIVFLCCFSCCFQCIRRRRAEEAYLKTLAARQAAGYSYVDPTINPEAYRMQGYPSGAPSYQPGFPSQPGYASPSPYARPPPTAPSNGYPGGARPY